MRNFYQTQLNKLDASIVEMGGLLETAIKNSISSLHKCDKAMVRDAKTIEIEVDQKEKEIETLCLKLILRQQPVASDFHLISSALKMITDMERIGDQTDDLTHLSQYLTDGRNTEVMSIIEEMGAKSLQMVKGAVDAYIKRDLQLARDVQSADDVVDNLFERTKVMLLDLIKKEDVAAKDAPDLLMISKYFEGMCDHAVNMADWVIFAFTGKHNNLDLINQTDNKKENISDEVLSDIM